MNKLIVHAANGRGYEKFYGAGYKYVLADRNWNDFDHYTLHELFLIMPIGVDNIKLADIKLFNQQQNTGSHLNFHIHDFVGFITQIEWAERILLLLSPKDREDLILELHIRFSGKLYRTQQAFLKSVLRDITFEQFEESQTKIKSIVLLKEDIASMIENNKEIFSR